MMPIEDDAWSAPVADVEPESVPQAQAARSKRPPPLPLAGAAAIIVVAVVVVVLVSGGGKSGLSKADRIAKADAICGSTFTQQNQDLSASNIAGATQLAQETLTRIRALGLPQEGADQVKAIENQEQQAVNLLDAAIQLNTSQPTTARADFLQAEQIIFAAQKAAGQFGMHVCNAGQ